MGTFIVFEGLDRSGKSTQCGLLSDSLRNKGIEVVNMKFPGMVFFWRRRSGLGLL